MLCPAGLAAVGLLTRRATAFVKLLRVIDPVPMLTQPAVCAGSLSDAAQGERLGRATEPQATLAAVPWGPRGRTRSAVQLVKLLSVMCPV